MHGGKSQIDLEDFVLLTVVLLAAGQVKDEAGTASASIPFGDHTVDLTLMFSGNLATRAQDSSLLSTGSDLMIATLSMLLEVKRHGGTDAFDPRTRIFAQHIRSVLEQAGIDVDATLDRMAAGEVLDMDAMHLDANCTEELKRAFTAAGTGPVSRCSP